MKNANFLKIVVITLILAYCGMYLTACALTIYEKDIIVIDNSNGIITCEDTNGEIWSYYGEAEIGDSLTLIMNNKGTDIIYDDEIVNVK